MYFNPQGEPITMAEWSKLFELRGKDADTSWWKVGDDKVGDASVSTVWLGLDHGYGAPPLIFETLVFDGDRDGECARYATWDESVAGHAAMVARVRGES